MLSSQTKDEVTDAAVSNLREAFGGTLSIDAMLAASEIKISDAICKVGFWRRKTKCVSIWQYIWTTLDIQHRYLKQAAQRLRDDFESDVPKTVDELCSLPGVGPKMAFLALHAAWNMLVHSHALRYYTRLKSCRQKCRDWCGRPCASHH